MAARRRSLPASAALCRRISSMPSGCCGSAVSSSSHAMISNERSSSERPMASLRLKKLRRDHVCGVLLLVIRFDAPVAAAPVVAVCIAAAHAQLVQDRVADCVADRDGVVVAAAGRASPLKPRIAGDLKVDFRLCAPNVRRSGRRLRGGAIHVSPLREAACVHPVVVVALHQRPVLLVVVACAARLLLSVAGCKEGGTALHPAEARVSICVYAVVVVVASLQTLVMPTWMVRPCNQCPAGKLSYLGHVGTARRQWRTSAPASQSAEWAKAAGWEAAGWARAAAARGRAAAARARAAAARAAATAARAAAWAAAAVARASRPACRR